MATGDLQHPEWVGHLLTPADLEAIAAGVTAAERLTSGQLRVHLEQRCPGDAIARGRQVFEALGMTRTRHRNGVLLYVAVDDHKFAVVGDEGIHGRVGSGFWDHVRDDLQERMRAGRARDGIVSAVLEIGRALGTYFPDRPDDVNELSDSVSIS